MRARAYVIVGLSALAVTQPLLDLFGRNPEFFVAGRYTGAQIVWFAVAVALVPPLVGILATAAAGLISPRAGTVTYVAVVAVLCAAFVLAVLRSAGVDAAWVVAIVAGLVAVALAYVVVRTRGGRLLASYLAVANLAFVAVFLFASPTAELVRGGDATDLGRVSVPPVPGPVVVVILDELPAATIMRADGTINRDRYPGFAELAAVSTWFRNASSPYNLTHRAVPAILSGTLAEPGDLPTSTDHPRTLFTLLGRDVPVHRYESVTDLCPPTICDPPPRRPLTQALEDASVVYGHRVLPSSLRDELPAIDNSWGAYGDQTSTGGAAADALDRTTTGDDVSEQDVIALAYDKWQRLGADERSPRGQAAVLGERIAAITPEPALHVVHVALPHRPWMLSRTGMATSYQPELITDPAAPGYEFGARLDAQLHAMQVGAADVLVGELVDHLRAGPAWADTLLVVTSDHGTNLTPPDIGRMRPTAANREEVYRVPLFVKAPGQTTGAVRDDTALTLDVLPSVADLLDVDTDWSFAGHSLYDGSAATTAPTVSPDVAAVLDIAARRAAAFGGDSWLGLAQVGRHGDLVGRRVDELDVGAASPYRTTLDQEELFADLPTPAATMPFVIAGAVTGRAEPPASELLVAVNGTVAGVVGGYVPAGNGWDFTGYVADRYRPGANTVELYEVRDAAGGPTLHPTG